MLCSRIDDPVESGAGAIAGLDLLDADIVFAPAKTLRRHEEPLAGYEIHHGQIGRCAEEQWLGIGLRRGAVYGTHWHGVLDNDDVRRSWLTEVAEAAGRSGFVVVQLPSGSQPPPSPGTTALVSEPSPLPTAPTVTE